ncbi:MAG TPA: site-specific DNA-methyltransferase [Methanosarcina sp.]|nr:site-specific DNA-methyltransferase [Methanosarcina sp.]
MQKLDPKTDGRSVDIVAENIDKLKTLFPEVFTEGGIDFDALKETLGEYIDGREERYSFTWNGKSKARWLAQTPSTGTLRPCPEESVNWDTTQNLFIEGDNLEVLKLLQKSYYKKVKMIYIDPPYNTGNDFIYPDDFRDNIKNYLELTGQVDNEGRKISTNSETSGRYHTDWLNMMYPRLKLARNYLRDDGIIFISIDDNEVANLRKVCDDIFGEENFLCTFLWKKRTGSNDAQNMISIDHDYVMAYAKTDQVRLNGLSKDFSNYLNPDNDPLGPWTRGDLTCNKTASERPNLYYPIKDPVTGIEYQCNPNRVWAYEKERMERVISEGKVLFPKNGNGTPMYKRHLSEVRSQEKPFSSIIDTVINTIATKETREILGGQYFDFPKSVDLIRQLIGQGTQKNDLILDFFSGSATTAHAVLDLNKDGDNRKFIVVQLPEPCDEKLEAFKTGYKTIAEIGKERIRRVIKKIKEETPDYEGDLGFKVFKLDSTNIKPWEVNPDNLQSSLEDYISNIKDGRSEHDILYEILLKYGLDLTQPIEERTIAGKTVFIIGYGALVICLADDITLETVEDIAGLKKELQPEIMRVVFKDTGFKDDVVKTNAVQILKLAGIEDVKSL